MQFLQTSLFHPQRHLFPLTPRKQPTATPAPELFAYWVNERGEIIVPEAGPAGNWTYYAKKIQGNGLTRGRRIKTRPASWFKTRQEALVALNNYAPTRGWIPAATFWNATSIARTQR
jgi:hypothetical protein